MDDECDIDTITAFLEASDSEEEVEETEQQASADSTDHEKRTAVSLEKNGDDFDDDMNGEELDELDNLLSQSMNDTEDRLVAEPEHNELGNTNDDDAKAAEEQAAMERLEAAIDDELEEKTEMKKEPPKTEAGFDPDIIKAEMAAMAERMRQLQEMLEKTTSPKSTPADKTVKKYAPVSPHSAKNNKTTSKMTATSDKRSSAPVKPAANKTVSENHERRKPVLENSERRKPVIENHERRKPGQTAGGANKIVKNMNNSQGKTSLQTLRTESQASHKNDPVNPFFELPGETEMKKNKESQGHSKPIPAVVTAKDVFGDSDDSDWDELDGGEKHELTKEGRELKKLISGGPRKREAHTPSYDTSILKKPSKPLNSWPGLDSSRPFQSTLPMKKVVPEKPLLNPDTGTVSGKYRVREEYKQKPSTLHQEDERESVTDPFCGIRIVNPRIPMEDFKSKMSGRSMIKIGRLLSKYGMTDFQKDNWVTMGVLVHKTEPRQSAAGKAYCIWKLSDLQDCEKTLTFFLFGNVYKEHWKHELGIVIGLLNPSIMDKAEKNQAEVAVTINHPQQLLFMGVSKDLGRCRGTTKAGQPCSSFTNKMQGEYCTYHVQAAYRKTSSKRTELQGSTGVTPKAFQQGKRTSKQDCFFYGGNTFTTMRPQKSTKDKVTINKLHDQVKGHVGKVTTMSLHELKPSGEMKLQKIEQKDKALLDLLTVPSAGAMNFVKHLVKHETEEDIDEKTKEKGVLSTVSASDLLKEHKRSIIQQKNQGKPVDLSALPKLGRGFGSGQEVKLDGPVKKVKGNVATELAKQLAIAKVRSKGGIGKEDPNSVRKKLKSPEAKEKIKKRVAEDMDLEMKGHDASLTSEPPRKKSKLLGNVDLNSPEVQQLLKSKSKHKGALAEAEAEHEAKYFNALEKKERMEDKMDSIMEVQVNLIHCVQCDYTFFSAHDRCKQENHLLKRVKGKKRFFKCKSCKSRTVSIQKICTEACKNCGSYSYDRVSMLKERSGPKLESEQLSLRGNEQTFVGSIQGKVHMNV